MPNELSIRNLLLTSLAREIACGALWLPVLFAIERVENQHRLLSRFQMPFRSVYGSKIQLHQLGRHIYASSTTMSNIIFGATVRNV